jgi:glycosyltransferase involved in cell wall biosynthesis
LVDGTSGFLIDASNRSLLAEKVVWLLQHGEQAGQMGQAGRAFVAAEFGVEAATAPLAKWLA